MKKIGIIGAGHPFQYQYQALKDLGYEIILCDKNLEKIKDYKEIKYDNYQNLLGKVDLVLISTPPKTHFEIINFFLKNNVDIICEKPLVTNNKDLKFLSQHQFHNILHFSHGMEINWFIKHLKDDKKINCIKAYINDPYIVNNKIREESISLHGAYLDETINPLSAIVRIFNKEPKFKSAKLNYLPNDEYDFQSKSYFEVNSIPIEINVSWNDNKNKDKYIDIYYQDRVIRVDSMNQSVIDITNKEILYKASGVRMYNHYLNGFKDFENNPNNMKMALSINEAILGYFK